MPCPIGQSMQALDWKASKKMQTTIKMRSTFCTHENDVNGNRSRRATKAKTINKEANKQFSLADILLWYFFFVNPKCLGQSQSIINTKSKNTA